jgi:hypothetical protein
MGGTNSRPHTRPPTPFNPSFSVPATPPDLYLVTRNSPNLSQSIWENFQPDQLFPEGSANMQTNQFSPPQPHHNLDPNLMSHMNMGQQVPHPGQSSQLPQRMRGQPGQPGMGGSPPMLNPGQPSQPVHAPAGYQVHQNVWQGGFDPHMQDPQGHSPSDTLSNASAQAVPMTMNVEDW